MIKLSKPLSEILQPLVDMVPRFRNERNLQKWLKDSFPCDSVASAAIASLAKWLQNKPIVKPVTSHWVLGNGNQECALCYENRQYRFYYENRQFIYGCGNCALPEVDNRKDCYQDQSAYKKVTIKNKQPLIDALELASVYALVDEFSKRCIETTEKVMIEHG